MIESMEISGCASYGDTLEEMKVLKAINFIYGSNGAGKTTISRLIADDKPQPGCAIHWEHGTQLDTLVYNRDFVHANFNQSNDLKGIFTSARRTSKRKTRSNRQKKISTRSRMMSRNSRRRLKVSASSGYALSLYRFPRQRLRQESYRHSHGHAFHFPALRYSTHQPSPCHSGVRGQDEPSPDGTCAAMSMRFRSFSAREPVAGPIALAPFFYVERIS